VNAINRVHYIIILLLHSWSTPHVTSWEVQSREKKGTLEVWRIPDIESLVDAVDRVHHFVILLLHSWSTPHMTAGQP
jgi:hypothetical protein